MRTNKRSAYVEVQVILQLTVSRPVRLGVRRPSGTRDHFSFSLKFSLDICGFVILLRPFWEEDGSVIYCFCWPSPAQSRSGLSPARLKTIFYCLIWDFSSLEGQVPVFISPRNMVVQLYPRALGSLSVASYDSQGYGGGILSRLHAGLFLCVVNLFSCKYFIFQVINHLDWSSQIRMRWGGHIARLGEKRISRTILVG
jgi:hypothetical protein